MNTSVASPLSRRDAAALRRQRILDAACDMIFERGYEPVSMSDIGAAVGVSGPAIYRHFQSKSDILAVLCGQTIDRLIEFVGPRRADPHAELGALIDGQVRLVVEYTKHVRVFEDEERALPQDLRREVRRREREHATRWVSALRTLYPEANVSALEIQAYSAVGMILSAPRWPRPLQVHESLAEELKNGAWRILGLARDA